MGDTTGKLIPSGELEQLDVEIYGQESLRGVSWAKFHFKDFRTTRRFCALFRELETKEFGAPRSAYNERLQSFVTLYPDMTLDEVTAKLKKDLEDLGGVMQR